MEKIEILHTVADELFATEKAVDDAIAQASDMLATLIQGRRDMNLSAVVGADAQAKVMDAIAAMGQARTAVVAAHADLAKVQRAVGLAHVAVGPMEKPEEDVPMGGGVRAERRLRVAAAQ